MKKIGTHNSGTGERPGNLLSWLGWPFARCQGKTLREQYDAGARMFDLRVKLYNHDWYLAHGAWHSRRTLLGALLEINDYPEVCRVILTYEGSRHDAAFARFCEMTDGIEHAFSTLRFVYIAVKRPKWAFVRVIDKRSYPVQGFVPITGWRRLLPVPWVWYFVRSLRYWRFATFGPDGPTFGAGAPTFGANAPTEDTKKWVLVDFL